jgi:hypothetical protein
MPVFLPPPSFPSGVLYDRDSNWLLAVTCRPARIRATGTTCRISLLFRCAVSMSLFYGSKVIRLSFCIGLVDFGSTTPPALMSEASSQRQSCTCGVSLQKRWESSC